MKGMSTVKKGDAVMKKKKKKEGSQMEKGEAHEKEEIKGGPKSGETAVAVSIHGFKGRTEGKVDVRCLLYGPKDKVLSRTEKVGKQ